MAILSFDKYIFYARLVPGLIVIFPIGLAIISLFPEKFLGWDILVAIGTSFGMSIYLAELARDKGREKQDKLYSMWGGKPTTVMLRHRDSPFDSITLARYHKKLGELIPEVQLPTYDDENKNTSSADEVYESCVAYLQEHTRDKKQFPLIFAELVSYGLRRNLWGMKSIGIILTLISMAIILWQIYPNFRHFEDVRPVVPIAMILDAILLALWILRVTPKWIKTTADAYALRLLSACDRL